MKRLSILIWLAIFTAVVPLLALPLWLMRPFVIALALSVAALGYSVFREYNEATESSYAKSSPSKPAFANSSPAEEEQSDEQSQKNPLDITDPDTDRFVATNTYERRRHLNT